MSTQTGERALVGLKDFAVLFPVKPQSVYRWRTPEFGWLPPEDYTIAGRPVWYLDRIIDWADARGMDYDRKAAELLAVTHVRNPEATAAERDESV